MFGLLLAAAMFLPHQAVTVYPASSESCMYNRISDPQMWENVCPYAVVVDTAYKNGMGSHNVLLYGDTLTTVKSVPFKRFICPAAQGVPSAAADHMVHPGYKTKGYVCLEIHLEFPYAGGQ